MVKFVLYSLSFFPFLLFLGCHCSGLNTNNGVNDKVASNVVLNMHDIILPVPRTAAFSLEGHGVWGHSITRTDDGKFYMFFSYVPNGLQHKNSRIGFAISDSATGPWTYQGLALEHGETWDSCYTHNPHIFKYKDKFYLYYSGHSGNLHYNKWVGIAIADHPSGPWKRFDEPVIDREVDFEAARCANNPSAIIGPDQKIWVFYSCRAYGWEAIHAARSDSPLGPFTKVEGVTGIGSKQDSIKVEDGVVWKYNGIYYFIVKDKSGHYNRTGVMSNSFFYSKDCIHWTPCPNPKVFDNPREITWEDGQKEKFERLERAQIWWDETGKNGVLSLAARKGSLGSGVGKGNYQALTIQVPLKIK